MSRVRKISSGAGRVTAALVSLPWLVAAGCGGGEAAEPDPGPAAEVREAALKTLGGGPAALRLSVSSSTAGYSARGAIELATDRFRLRVRISRAPITHFDRVLDVVGVGGETYLARSGSPAAIENGRLVGTVDPSMSRTPGECWFDPHAPVGSIGGAASVQEAMALAGVTVRLLRDGIRTAVLVRDDAGRGKTYRVAVDPRKASLAPSSVGSDEILIVAPRRLARHLTPIRARVNARGLVRRLSFELRRWRPARVGPGLVRERRRERVSVTIRLSDFGRALDVRAPRCVAME